MQKRLGLLFAALVFPSPTFAEVCDKEVPDWNPSDGPVGLLEGFLTDMAAPIPIGLLVAAALALYLNKPWLLLPVAILLGIASVLLTVDTMVDDVYYASIREGCRASPDIQIFLYGSLAVLCTALALYPLATRWIGHKP